MGYAAVSSRLMLVWLLVGCGAGNATQPSAALVSSSAALEPATIIAPRSAAEEKPNLLAVPDYGRLADEVDAHLYRQVVDRWYPLIVDEKAGGFGPHLKNDWSPETGPERDNRFLVFQARMTWVAAEIAGRSPERRAAFERYARHGLDWLEKKQWDNAQGGFFWNVSKDGAPTTPEKHVYGIAFGMYASATVAQKLKDERARALALKTFQWLEQKAHDEKNGGYFEALSREGKPLLSATDPKKTKDLIGTVYGRKSMNTHIHLLEALTALDAVAPEPKVHERLAEVFALVRDKICDARGFLNLYFEPNWKPVPDVDSYGHDVETAFLLLEAAERLGRANEPETQRIARALVDHALKFGWDAKYGGFYDQGPIEAPATVTDKGWWMQAEGLNALLLMHELYGRSSPDYYKAFEAQWSFITRFQLDPKYGDWWNVVARDGKVLHPETGKGGEWKEAYHQSRALMNTADRLRRLATRSGARLAWSDGKNLRDGPRRPAGAVRSTRQPPPLPLFRTSCSKNLPAELACPPRRTKALWQRAPARIRFW